jgi:4-oxalocrotonate tautomerase
MPFVNIQLVAGHDQQRKDEIAKRVADAINEVTQIPLEAIWVVFQDVAADDWYVAGQSVSARRMAASK